MPENNDDKLQVTFYTTKAIKRRWNSKLGMQGLKTTHVLASFMAQYVKDTSEQTSPDCSDFGKQQDQTLTLAQQRWLDLGTRADAVRDKFWKGMLKMIKEQLKHVAKVAAEEAAEDDHDQESEGIRGAAPRGRARSATGGPVQSIARAKK